jgi:hypothetical protein
MNAHIGRTLARRLFLFCEPVAHMIDVVEDEASDFYAGRTETPGSETLQRADG